MDRRNARIRAAADQFQAGMRDLCAVVNAMGQFAQRTSNQAERFGLVASEAMRLAMPVNDQTKYLCHDRSGRVIKVIETGSDDD